MTTSLRPGDTSHGFPTDIVEVVRARAERHATMVGEYLRAAGIDVSGAVDVPQAFFLELAAVLQICEWDRQGVPACLGHQLPTSAAAITQIRARIRKGPDEFAGPDAAPLSRQVLRACVERLAWCGPEYLGADIALGQVDADEFVESLAEFLWEHRHEISYLFDMQEYKEPLS